MSDMELFPSQQAAKTKPALSPVVKPQAVAAPVVKPAPVAPAVSAPVVKPASEYEIQQAWLKKTGAAIKDTVKAGIDKLNTPNTPVKPGSSRDIYDKEVAAEAANEKRLANKKAKEAASGIAPQVEPVAPAVPATVAAPVADPVAPSRPVGGSTTNALPQMTGYDAATQAALGQGNPAEAMKLAQAAAAQTAQTQSDAAIRQAVKGAKTSGALGGQAALMGTSAGSDAYGQGMAQGTQQYFDTTKLGASLGSEMSQRLARGEAIAAQERQAAAQNALAASGQAQSASAQKANETQSWWDRGIGLVGGIASLFGGNSDIYLKKDIKETSLTKGLGKIKSYAYRYKDSPRQEAGLMAQELEKTPMKSAVYENQYGKAVDGQRLSTMNTAALSEHEKRLKDIERLIKGMGEIQKPKGKE